jgi:hypothetical protein
MQIMIDQTQREGVEHFIYFGSIKNYAREIKLSIVKAKASSNRKTFSPTNLT